MPSYVIPSAEAGLTGCLEAGLEAKKARLERRQTWLDAVFGDGEESCLGSLIGGLEVLGDMIEGLADSGI